MKRAAELDARSLELEKEQLRIKQQQLAEQIREYQRLRDLVTRAPSAHVGGDASQVPLAMLVRNCMQLLASQSRACTAR